MARVTALWKRPDWAKAAQFVYTANVVFTASPVSEDVMSHGTTNGFRTDLAIAAAIGLLEEGRADEALEALRKVVRLVLQ